MIQIIGTIVICWLVADLITGLAHWWEDTYCPRSIPFINSHICGPNDLHHTSPMAFLVNGFVDRNYIQWLLAVGFYAALWFVGLGNFPVALTLAFASLGNEVHYWCHAPSPHPVASALQMAGIIQSKANHNAHHRGEQITHYCTLGNACNVVLERIGFWRKLEAVVASTLKIQPSRVAQEEPNVL